MSTCLRFDQNSDDYQKASYPLRSVFAQAFFKQIKIKNGEITFAELNAPLDYVCNEKLQGDPVFKLERMGGSGRKCHCDSRCRRSGHLGLRARPRGHACSRDIAPGFNPATNAKQFAFSLLTK